VNEIGITRELAPKPRGIAKGSKHASKHLQLLSSGKRVARGEPRSSGVEL
jgi:hypothetical protein